MFPVGVDSTTTRAHHDASGMRVGEQTLVALEEAASPEGGPSEEQDGQDGDSDPARAERRRIRRGRRAGLKAALLGRSRGGLTSRPHLAAGRR